MRIDQDKCIACLECIDYCPVSAISEKPDGTVVIDEDECVECGVCLRAEVCVPEALHQPPLQWPRKLRADFSDTTVIHPATGVGGRGTEEMKTNDVTGRYPRGMVGMAVELGRPGTGARLRDLEKVAIALARMGIRFETANPVYQLFSDPATGKLKDEVLNEKVLSAIVEFGATPEVVPQVVQTLRQVAQEIDTVFSVDMISLVEPDGSIPVEAVARAAGVSLRPNGKNNLGLGRPRHQFFQEGAA